MEEKKKNKRHKDISSEFKISYFIETDVMSCSSDFWIFLSKPCT